MTRCKCFKLQPELMNSDASQSSNSGCVGGSLRVPKSEGDATSGSPKCSIQTRFTSTRAVSGLAGEAIARASSRRPLPCVNGCGTPPLNTCRKARRISALENMWRVRLGQVRHDHRARGRRVGGVDGNFVEIGDEAAVAVLL